MYNVSLSYFCHAEIWHFLFYPIDIYSCKITFFRKVYWGHFLITFSLWVLSYSYFFAVVLFIIQLMQHWTAITVFICSKCIKSKIRARFLSALVVIFVFLFCEQFYCSFSTFSNTRIMSCQHSKTYCDKICKLFSLKICKTRGSSVSSSYSWRLYSNEFLLNLVNLHILP